MAKPDKENKSQGDKASSPKPLRTTVTAFGAGIGWAAWHMPSIHGLNPPLIAWLVDALIAALIAKVILDLGMSVLSWAGRAFKSLVSGV